MDAKNDDSAGSDSLDKSLQKKCVVDDVGQGEGSTANAAALAHGINIINEKPSKSDNEETENRPAISINTQVSKTEKNVGDGICDGKNIVAIENNYKIDENMDGLDIQTINDTKSAQMLVTYEKSNANDTITTANANTSVNNNAENDDFCTHIRNDSTHISNIIMNDVAEAPSYCSTNNDNSNCNSNNSNAFETKVKQISKNLKETTLAECVNKKSSTTTEDTNSTSSASSASSASSTPECEQPPSENTTTAELYSLGPSTSAAAAAAAAAAASGTNVQDEHDHRSKKVRFHPDVKENDGGNRVIPKKKKKLKTQGGASSSGDASSGGDEASGGSQRGMSAEDDMELDEEDDVEEEDIVSIAKTIEDAQDYLKEHPLTFAGSFDKSNVTTQSGLLEEEDLPQLCEIVEDDEEDMHGEVVPENGVACILGKQIKCGKVEFLLRYADRPGLYWETEEFISQRCPNLLNQYELCRERRQARLMNFVAKRQNLRQRYTDF
ncbi:uncharacterized protein [Eurosta solidaginis]|uniref:uncharacterized protein n=1 Tax=Eurosta solidaginis TaxID=178769 RepID=UPI0035311EA1